MAWLEDKLLAIRTDTGKDFVCIEGWTTKETEQGLCRHHLSDYYWFEGSGLNNYLKYMLRGAVVELSEENPDKLYRYIEGYKNGRTTT